MFKFKLQSALFDSESLSNSPEQGEEELIKQETKEHLNDLKDDIQDSRKNNESISSQIESKEITDKTDENLAKLLKNLAKNKKLNYSWNNEEWKCSSTEKKLAIASVKVFQELLSKQNVQKMIEKCMQQNSELTDTEAEQRKTELNINSKISDIKSFYKSYKEYQNSQSEYDHLKWLMWFLCENIETKDSMYEALENQSKKITSKEISTKWKNIYEKVLDSNWYSHWVDKRNEAVIDREPKDRKKRAAFEIIVDRLKEKEANTTDKMLTLLWDYNLDWEINSWDVGWKTGTQLGEVFRRIVATKKLEDHKFDDNTAVKNLMDFLNIDWINTVDELYAWMTNYEDINNWWYQNTQKLQNLIKNLPIELWDVLKNWSNAGKESLTHISWALEIKENEKEAAEQAANEKAKELINKYDSLLKERITDATQRANITQQLLSQLPGVLMEQAKNMQKGPALWIAIPLDQLIRWLSLWLNVWIDEDWKPHFGIYGAWWHDFLLWHWVDINTWVSAWLNSFLIPCESLFTELGVDLSEGNRNESLDALWINRISLGANCTLYGPLFSRWVSAWYENNKQAWIEKQTKNINSQLQGIWEDLINSLIKESASDLNQNLIKEKLSEKFPKSSEEELNMASDNILNLVKTFKLDENTTENDVKLYAHIIADVYSEMWRNDAINHIADNKWKLSWGKVGIQFLAWYFPTAVLVTKFTRYYNARSIENERSKEARIDAAVNGTWNRSVDLGESKEIGGSQITQINEILKQYGAKSELIYMPWEENKPGKIAIPTSIAWLWINIRVSRNLQWKVQWIDGRYLFPANTTYRLLQETSGDQKSITLNIGSDRNNDSDISISNIEALNSLIGNDEIMWETKYEYKWEFEEVEQWLEFKVDNIDNLFTNEVKEWLKTIDSANWARFSEFMKKKVNSGDLNETVSALLNCLPNISKYQSIRKALDPKSGDCFNDVDRQLIIDRILAITATANVGNKRWLEANIKWRWEYYKKESMRGSNGQSIFNTFNEDYRSNLIEQIQKDWNYNINRPSNLLWATAFYHKNNKEKGLAMTGLWVTSVLWSWITEIKEEDKETVKNWFLWTDNVPGVLSKENFQMKNLKSAISKYIQDEIGEFWKESNLSSKLSDEDLKKLLKWEEIELDISNGKCKVMLDVKYVFYLMGECANESVGMQLWKLSIKKQEPVEHFAEWQLLLNDGDGTSSVQTSRRDFAVGLSFGWKKKEEDDWGSTPWEDEEPINDADSTPWEDEQPVDPSTQPNKWEEPINWDSTGWDNWEQDTPPEGWDWQEWHQEWWRG